ncbi:MAG: A/G-specific adenine glycosylase [Gammaproteobacteria bacterium]
MSGDDFRRRLLDWYDHHGRHDLPWQTDRSPYRVWISEIMLQQTQVSTVIPYFERFTGRFPDVADLADAPTDEVLHLWSGLGYYARARNLHRAASLVVEQHDGHLPSSFDALLSLPGIGQSTAGAILALSADQRHPILDGNVKRVLCRYSALSGWPGRRDIEKRLWAMAEELTPAERVADYTQAMMDLGATLCRRGQPDCQRCPLRADCRARAEGIQTKLPTPRPKKTRPRRQTQMMLVVDDDGRVLLRRRDADGLWGGLWSLPELESGADAAAWYRQHFGKGPGAISTLPVVRHGFTHFELEIQPVMLRVGDGSASGVMDGDGWLWYNRRSPSRVGLAAVVERLLEQTETIGATVGDADEQDGQLRTAESRG